MDTDALAERIVKRLDAALESHRGRATELILRLAEEAFADALEAAGQVMDDEAATRFAASLLVPLSRLHPDGTDAQVERLARAIAHAALNAAVVTGGGAGEGAFEWRTMRDDRVRELHRPMDGQVRAAGERFDVGGYQLAYPGEPVGPPEVWINCRCVLVPTTLAASAQEPTRFNAAVEEHSRLSGSTLLYVPEPDTLVARTYSAEQRRQMAQKGQALADGSFPIADVEDLRNAIAAIGRAKDPDKARRHIRKRAKALGATNLLPESWTASGEWWLDDSMVARARPSPPGTHDAPGWITHPRETQRLRTYWTRGEGAAKIRWGEGGDFDRCRRQLAKYVPPGPHLDGTCANLHFVALGFWPGQPPHGRRKKARVGAAEHLNIDMNTEEFQAVTAAFTAAAELDDELPPREWFDPPPLTAATPVTVTDDDEFVAHLATWDTCHVGISGGCTTPPHSQYDYAYFRTGEMITAGGPVAVGQITMETGHAGTELGPAAAVSHYDDTGTVVADVAAGEDDIGIWVHGMLRPGLTSEQRRALRAGSLSGDWRRIGGNLELVAALVVNVPGFPVPRVELAASGERALALTAAAIVLPDPNAEAAERIALTVIARLDERERHRANAARVAAAQASVNPIRARELARALGDRA